MFNKVIVVNIHSLICICLIHITKKLHKRVFITLLSFFQTQFIFKHYTNLNIYYTIFEKISVNKIKISIHFLKSSKPYGNE